MKHALHRLHTCKYVFLLGGAGKTAKAKANALRMELVKERKVDEERNAKIWTLSNKPCEMKASWVYISHERYNSNE